MPCIPYTSSSVSSHHRPFQMMGNFALLLPASKSLGTSRVHCPNGCHCNSSSSFCQAFTFLRMVFRRIQSSIILPPLTFETPLIYWKEAVFPAPSRWTCPSLGLEAYQAETLRQHFPVLCSYQQKHESSFKYGAHRIKHTQTRCQASLQPLFNSLHPSKNHHA